MRRFYPVSCAAVRVQTVTHIQQQVVSCIKRSDENATCIFCLSSHVSAITYPVTVLFGGLVTKYLLFSLDLADNRWLVYRFGFCRFTRVWNLVSL